LVAGHLLDGQSGLGDADVHQRLDFEAVAVDAHVWEATRPEGVVAVTEVGIARVVQGVYERVESAVAKAPGPGDVRAGAALCEARSLHEVGAVAEGRNEARNLRRVG